MEPMANENAALLNPAVAEGTAQRPRSRKARTELNPGTAEALTRRLCDVLDAGDFYGRHASLPAAEKIGKLFLASAGDRQQSEFNCTVSPKVRQQVPLLFQAMAGVMEERSGLLIQSSAEINGEGFGRGLLYSGRVILVLRSLRAGFPFPFTSLEKTIRYGAEGIEEGLAFLDKYHELTSEHGLLSLEG